jgi:hypothetical protein
MAAFCDFGVSLRTPNSWHQRWKFLKVSGRRPEYSRFREPAAGDRVRSALPGHREVIALSGGRLRQPKIAAGIGTNSTVSVVAGVAFAVEGDGIGFATESYAASTASRQRKSFRRRWAKV